nr:UDP-D-xylose:ribitol-5-phosphate beta1,4-xylosyltransferase-like isoform X3 [Halyomorpha halys]
MAKEFSWDLVLKSFKAAENVEHNTYHQVHIIGKAAIGQYLWSHLFNGSLDIIDKGFFQNGNKTIDNIIFTYYSGPGYIQNSIPQEIQFLVLIINGRTFKHVLKAKEWLDFLPEIHSLKKTAIILLGNEKCENHWILPYMKSKGGIIDILFIVYDSALIDNKEIFQWPLGVATWLPNESKESLAEYLSILQDSDFTLNPVGENTECYRIYEAAALGSIPIIEDNMTPGLCVSPLRLLKKFNPPFIFVKSWKTLHEVLQTDNFNFENIIEQRIKLLLWYDIFKKNIVTYFLNILKESFFSFTLSQ